MTTPYFLLAKPVHGRIDDDTDNQIVFLNRKRVFLLPEINIDYYAKYGLFENQLNGAASIAAKIDCF